MLKTPYKKRHSPRQRDFFVPRIYALVAPATRVLNYGVECDE
nr:MAG TPA: hypothetical protein [Caudoviricetes sp.]